MESSAKLSIEVFEAIFPVWTYSQLVFLLIFGVSAETHVIGYHAIVVVGALLFLAEPFFMIFGESIFQMQACEVVVGAATASIQIFSAYTYTILPLSFFQRITSYTRMSFLLGTVSSSLTGQLLLLFDVLSITQLYYITAATSSLALVVAFFLPRHPLGGWETESVALFSHAKREDTERNVVDGDTENARGERRLTSHSVGECDDLGECQRILSSDSPDTDSSLHRQHSPASSYFSSGSPSSSLSPPPSPLPLLSSPLRTPLHSIDFESVTSESHSPSSPKQALSSSSTFSSITSVFSLYFFRTLYRKYRPVYRLSLWLIFSLPIHTLVLTYFQVLVSVVVTSADSVNYNGFVLSASYVMAAAVSLLPSKWERFFSSPLYLECSLILISCVSSLLLIFLSLSHSLVTLYPFFIVYHCLFEFLLTLLFASIAKETPVMWKEKKPFGLTFSLCVFCAMSVQSFIQLIVGVEVLDLGIREQFLFWGFGYLIFTFCMFLSFVIFGR